MSDKYMTRPQAAKYLGLSISTFRRLVNQYPIPDVSFTRSRRCYLKADLDALKSRSGSCEYIARFHRIQTITTEPVEDAHELARLRRIEHAARALHRFYDLERLSRTPNWDGKDDPNVALRLQKVLEAN